MNKCQALCELVLTDQHEAIHVCVNGPPLYMPPRALKRPTPHPRARGHPGARGPRARAMQGPGPGDGPGPRGRGAGHGGASSCTCSLVIDFTMQGSQSACEDVLVRPYLAEAGRVPRLGAA